MDEKLKVSVEIRDCISVNNDLEKNLLDTDLARQTLAECPDMAAGSTNNLSEVNANKEMKIRLKQIKKKVKSKVEVQSIETKTDTVLTRIFVEGNVNKKRKRRRKKIKKKTKNKDEIESMDQTDEMLNLHISDGDHGRGNDGKLTENDFTAQESEVSLEKESSESLEERSGDFLRPMEVEAKLSPCECQHSTNPNQMDVENPKFENCLNEVNNEIVVDEGKCLAEGRSVLSTCDVGSTHISYPDVKEANDCRTCPQIAWISYIKRKLLVLDVNGLLANIVFPAPKDCRGDTHILGRAVFKRPFCDDFLKFCFQNFDVGIWSSRSKKLIDKVVEYLLGNLQDQMLFCWDMSHSTQTGFKTLENCHKPLVCKELVKIWESDDPNLRWKKGYYNESNTLLLDDSPYKALLNPLHTAIFPNSYHYEDKNDNSLGPGGDLRVYLEGLLTSENVQKYVEQHPFGQSAINESSLSWGFYSGVLQTMSIDNTLNSLPTLS